MTREDAIDVMKCLAWHTRPDEEEIEQAIKTLEQEPCEDAVSRKAIVEMLNARVQGSVMTFDHFIELLYKLPSVTPTQRWIPTSERMPKESGFYLVSTTDCITIMEFCKGWISQNIGSCNWYVKAWMPLPKGYVPDTNVGKMEETLSYADQDTMQPAT